MSSTNIYSYIFLFLTSCFLVCVIYLVFYGVELACNVNNVNWQAVPDNISFILSNCFKIIDIHITS